LPIFKLPIASFEEAAEIAFLRLFFNRQLQAAIGNN